MLQHHHKQQHPCRLVPPAPPTPSAPPSSRTVVRGMTSGPARFPIAAAIGLAAAAVGGAAASLAAAAAAALAANAAAGLADASAAVTGDDALNRATVTAIACGLGGGGGLVGLQRRCK